VRLFKTGVRNNNAEVRNAAVLTSFIRVLKEYRFQCTKIKARKLATEPAKILKKMSSS
jgi:hypothetical protein